MAANSPRILALDPGKDKCGLAAATWENGQCQILAHRIVRSTQLEEELPQWLAEYQVEKIVIGDATTSAVWRGRLAALLPNVELATVEEAGSTLEARALYWEANPPRGWRRLLPLSLQAPPEPVDDFAAVVLARRYFAGKN